MRVSQRQVLKFLRPTNEIHKKDYILPYPYKIKVQIKAKTFEILLIISSQLLAFVPPSVLLSVSRLN